MANLKYDGELISNAFMKAIGGKYYNNFVKAGFNSAKEYTWNEINDMLVKAGAGTMDCFKMSNTLEDMAKLPQWQDFIYESKKAKMKSFRKFVESTKKITESSLRDQNSIELGNTTGVLKFSQAVDGVFLEMWAGGAGYDRPWKNKEFAEKRDQAMRSQDKALIAEVEKEFFALRDDILKVANNYDREIEKVMNKHGFRK